ncbi:hypothetical protein TeGR_g7891, partial [Tetraparma gracilis]
PPPPLPPDGVLLLYFSASWCPPCRQLTPELVKFYNHANAEGKTVEVILVPCEAAGSAAELAAYAAKYNLPFLAIDPANPLHGDAVKSVYGIWAGPRDGRVLGAGAHAGIPQLIEVDRGTGQPKGNWRGRVGEYNRKHGL